MVSANAGRNCEPSSPSPSLASASSSSTLSSAERPYPLPHIVRLIPKQRNDSNVTVSTTTSPGSNAGGGGGAGGDQRQAPAKRSTTGNTNDNDTTSDDNTIISCDATCGSTEQLRSCLSRRTSSAVSSGNGCGSGSGRKQVEYSERAIVIDAHGRLSDEAIALKMIEDLVEMHSSAASVVAAATTAAAATSSVACDDNDDVFSDSIEPQLPRGDMCTPYPKKRSSIPGLMFLPDWFPDDTRCVSV